MEISRVSEINYEEFVNMYLSQNLPCLFDKNFTKKWKSRKEWIKDGKPCFEFLSSSFGEAVVPIADCNQVKFQSHPKQSMLFKDFIKYWASRRTDETLKETKRYLKDWHFCKSFPHYNAYETPNLFQSDWLNEFWDGWTEETDDYRFVYMGPQGTWTPFHVDVFRSFSWSANICGIKKWILYPPGAEKYLKDNHGNLIFDLTSHEVNDRKEFPLFDKAPPPIVVNQREGEIIFVPSCWHHQVINMEDTISINHNWINGSGVFKTWLHLKDELQLVKHSIDDCKDMDGWAQQCQTILKANSGMNFQTFFTFLSSISYTRLCFLKMQCPGNPVFENEYKTMGLLIKSKNKIPSTLKEHNSREQCLFDLKKITEVLDNFVVNEDMEELLKNKCMCLLGCLMRINSYQTCK